MAIKDDNVQNPFAQIRKKQDTSLSPQTEAENH